jgi:hypothetical protein
VVQLHVVGSHASQAGQDLGKRGDDQVFAVAARKKNYQNIVSVSAFFMIHRQCFLRVKRSFQRIVKNYLSETSLLKLLSCYTYLLAAYVGLN